MAVSLQSCGPLLFPDESRMLEAVNTLLKLVKYKKRINRVFSRAAASSVDCKASAAK